MTVESQIHADIEVLRKNAQDTQTLYREVCATLFFRYGITPTANKLYHYVRKGSMSAPAEALSKFWEDLREKSRIRIEHPDLPDAVKAAAGDLVATLWTQAQESAKEGLDAFRADAHATAEEAQAKMAAANKELQIVKDELSQARQTIGIQNERLLILEREVAAERSAKETLAVQLESSAHKHTILEAALAEARRDFATELEKNREALQRSEERCEAMEKRSLLEIDRERTVAIKYQKELTQVQRASQEVEQRLRNEMALIQVELGNARQELGIAEGSVLELRANSLRTAEQLQLRGAEIAKSETEKALLRRELVVCQSSLASLTEELRQARASGPSKDKERKARKISIVGTKS